MARLGAPFPLYGLGLVGDDDDGRAILVDCASRGIDVSRLGVSPEAGTSCTDVMTVRATGRRTFFHYRGANARLGPDDIRLDDCSARLFHFGYLLLLDRLDQIGPDGSTGAAGVLKPARALGMFTSVDVVSEHGGRFATVVGPSLPHTDVLNELEAARSAGVDVTAADGRLDFDRVSEAAARLLAMGRAQVGRDSRARGRPRARVGRHRGAPTQRRRRRDRRGGGRG